MFPMRPPRPGLQVGEQSLQPKPIGLIRHGSSHYRETLAELGSIRHGSSHYNQIGPPKRMPAPGAVTPNLGESKQGRE
jgi:hypothetical protein